MNFEFIVEENFKNIIYYDCENLYKYIEEGKIKNIINITESIIKAIIIYYFIYHSQDKISMKKILNFDLKELMELGYSKKICNINSMSLYNDLQILKIEIDPNNVSKYSLNRLKNIVVNLIIEITKDINFACKIY